MSKHIRVSDFEVSYANLSGLLKISCYSKTINRKQDKKWSVFWNKNFIQSNDKFANRSTDFLRVRSPRNGICHASDVVYFNSRYLDFAALRIKLWNLSQLTRILLLNNTFRTYQHLKILFTRPWNPSNVLKPYLKWASSVFIS